MTAKTRISIVTVSYNSVDTIEKAIQSVISQPYENKEYIIIDGGSIDGTLEVIRKYQNFISYWVSEPDRGIYHAMNKGVKVATGDLIAFLSSNDWYEENILGIVAKKFEDTSPDLIYGGITVLGEDGEQRKIFGEVNLKDFCYGFPFAHPATFVRTALQKKYGFDEAYHIAADYKFCMQLCCEGYRFERVDANLAYFCLGGASSRVVETAYETRRAAFEVLGDDYREVVEAAYNLRLIPVMTQRLSKETDSIAITNYIDKNQPVYLFGTGDIGVQCLRILHALGVEIKGFLDNSLVKQEKTIQGISVQSPNSISAELSATIVIASAKYGTEMEQQLLSMNLSDSIKIVKCEDIIRNILLEFSEK